MGRWHISFPKYRERQSVWFALLLGLNQPGRTASREQPGTQYVIIWTEQVMGPEIGAEAPIRVVQRHTNRNPQFTDSFPQQRAQNLLGMSSLKKRGTNHHSFPFCRTGVGPSVTLCAGVSSRVSGNASWGGPCRKLPLCFWVEPAGPETAPTESTVNRETLHITGGLWVFTDRRKAVWRKSDKAWSKCNHPFVKHNHPSKRNPLKTQGTKESSQLLCLSRLTALRQLQLAVAPVHLLQPRTKRVGEQSDNQLLSWGANDGWFHNFRF